MAEVRAASGRLTEGTKFSKMDSKGGETMLESEAMAILVGAGVSYGRREAALRAAGSASAILAKRHFADGTLSSILKL